jgi:hypothetical protein
MRFGSNLLRPNPRPSPIAANNAGSYMRRDLIPNVAGIPSLGEDSAAISAACLSTQGLEGEVEILEAE